MIDFFNKNSILFKKNIIIIIILFVCLFLITQLYQRCQPLETLYSKDFFFVCSPAIIKPLLSPAHGPQQDQQKTNQQIAEAGCTKILGTDILWIWGKFGHKVECGKNSLLSGRFGDPGHSGICV